MGVGIDEAGDDEGKVGEVDVCVGERRGRGAGAADIDICDEASGGVYGNRAVGEVGFGDWVKEERSVDGDCFWWRAVLVVVFVFGGGGDSSHIGDGDC